MIDDFIKKMTTIFEKNGSPSLNPDKYNLNESELDLFKFLLFRLFLWYFKTSCCCWRANTQN